MYEKTCRCGKSKKNFKVDIGPFYVDECCLEAGYDEAGNLKKKDIDPALLPSQEEVDQIAANLQEDTSPEPEDPPEPPPEETKEQKKARKQAEKEAKEKAKAEKKAAKEAAKAKKDEAPQ